jgi:hypothetical protein
MSARGHLLIDGVNVLSCLDADDAVRATHGELPGFDGAASAAWSFDPGRYRGLGRFPRSHWHAEVYLDGGRRVFDAVVYPWAQVGP